LRPQAQNKIEIILSGGFADRKNTYRLARVVFDKEVFNTPCAIA
jgi:hypothetical protein